MLGLNPRLSLSEGGFFSCVLPCLRFQKSVSGVVVLGSRFRLVTLGLHCSLQIEATLKLHSNRLFSIDRMFQLDLCVMEQVTGAEGASLLKASFEEKCLASEDVDLPLCDAIAAAKLLLESPAFTWAAPEAKADLKEAMAMIKRIDAQEPIITSSAQVSDWLAKVRVRLSYFLREKIAHEAEGDSERSKLLFGRAALKHRWTKVRAESESKLESYRIFAVWKHLMTPEMEADLTQVQKQCLQSAAYTFKNAAVSRSRPEAKKKLQKQNLEDDLDATAMAMLGMA